MFPSFKKLGNIVCRSRMYLQPDKTKYLTKLTHCNEYGNLWIAWHDGQTNCKLQLFWNGIGGLTLSVEQINMSYKICLVPRQLFMWAAQIII